MTTLYDALLAYGKSDVYPFHMPGHKRQVEDFENPFLIDITEIDGFDNLHHPEGILKEAQERAAEVYGSRSTYFLAGRRDRSCAKLPQGFVPRLLSGRPGYPQSLPTVGAEVWDKRGNPARRRGKASEGLSENSGGAHHFAYL